jgi:glucose/arabinose dehydrogenase
LILTALLLIPNAYAQDKSLPLDKIKLPPGFKISLYADQVPNAREMVLGDKGTLFVGSMKEGNVYAITGDPKVHNQQQVFIIAKDLNMPVGVAFKDGALYISEVNRIIRLDNIEQQLNTPPKPVVVNDNFPDKTHHGWKFIAFGPDGWLYVPVGAPCNICESKDPRFATIMRMKPDGKNLEIFAKGIRNTVGFDWDPVTKELWFTDNGRDRMGNDTPPDELNKAPKKGMNFGYPYCHGTDIADPEYKQHKCNEFTPPVVNLGPHVAALGMRFYTGNMFPAQYKHHIFIAEHGSWNRDTPIGYRIMMVDPNKNPQQSYQVFAEGWLQGDKAWGRPADVLVMPDGALLVSDDEAGVIYRITYEN